MALDKVPGELNVYIGGLFTLRRKDLLRSTGITHVLSVLGLPLDNALFEGFQHKVVEVDDTEDENLIQYFPACNRFIQAAIDAGGAVLVHCAMGKSRSATVVCAYLMHLDRITSAEALAQVRQTRPFCEPNDGFMQQLDLYHETDMADELDAAPAYQRWLYRRELDLSRACGQAPEPDKIRFEDEHARDAASAELELRCRKCRRPLATSAFLVPHRPRAEDSATSPTTAPIAPSPNCAHYFLDPLAWMRPELEQGKLDGRLECPKCRTNVGKYAWHGMRCSCGDWLVPGISLAKGRVDEVRSRSAAASAAAGPGMGIRLPPTNATQGEGRRAGGGQENL